MAHVHTHETRAWWLLSGAAPETPKPTSRSKRAGEAILQTSEGHALISCA